MVTLTLKEQPAVPLEAECLSPDVIEGQAAEAIRALPVFLGKRKCRVDDFFNVESSEVDALEIRGDARQAKWIGKGMTKGTIRIVGNAGMHLGAHMKRGTINVSGNASDWVGAEMTGGLIRVQGNAGGQIGAAYRGSMAGMKGGAIEVSGNASDWVGAEMTGGLIRVQGNAGGQIGAAYRGSLAGMNGGTILIGGSAGLEVGMRMKRGIIVVGGPVRDFAGLQMKGGTIFLLGGAEIRTGAWMIRGTIVSLKPIRLLPTFSQACAYNPTFIHVYARHLEKLGIPIPHEVQAGAYLRYSGDTSVPGKGEILVWQPHGR